jgi:Heterokaryon incompatibility protein (HET)
VEISTKDDEGKLHLKEIRTGADVLHAVQCCIGLATKKSPLSETYNLTERLEEIAPSRNADEDGPATTLDPIYSAVQLDDTKTQIRLIKLLPGQPQDPVNIDLITVKSVSSQPYEALSYVWGPPDANAIIKVNGKPFEVTANLHDALSCLRQIEKERVLWADAVCINQAHDFEKSSQVSMMGDIYRNAAEVIVFLGKERDGSAMIMQYFGIEDAEEIDIGSLESEGPSLTSNRRKWQKETDRDLKDASLIQARIQQCGFDKADFLIAADAFFKRPWWSRIWTVQEYELAKNEPRWYCGRSWTSTGHLRERMVQLNTYVYNHAQPFLSDVAMVTNEQIDIGREWLKIFGRRSTIKMQLARYNPLADWAQPTHFLLRLAYRQSTDPRDRIYALGEMLDPVSKQVFIPDYSVSADEVFMKLTIYVLCHDKFGNIYASYETNRRPGMPSWVLDFTKPFSVHANAHLVRYINERAPLFETCSVPPDKDDMIGLWKRNIGRLCIYNRVLSVMGVEIDIIDHTAYFENETDIRRLGLVWKLEGMIQNYHPSKALPESANPFLPRGCLVPFPPSLKEHFENLGSQLLGQQFDTTGRIPGYYHVWAEMMKLQCTLYPDRQTIPETVTCKDWETAGFPWSWDWRYGNASKLYAAFIKPNIAETLLGGACFDLPNLKKQITSITLPEQNPLEPPEDTMTTEAKSSDNGGYIPQYQHIKNILLQSRSKEELAILKKAAIELAEACCGIVGLQVAKAGPPGTHLLAEVKASVDDYFATLLSTCRSISEKCTCEGERRNRHQSRLKEYITQTENALSKAEATLIEEFRRFKGETLPQSNEMNQTVTRQYTSMFVTSLGLFGAGFQTQAEFGIGCRLVVLDGIPVPMVLERVDGLTYRMKGATHVMGINHIDIEKLVELGVFTRRRFHIV